MPPSPDELAAWAVSPLRSVHAFAEWASGGRWLAYRHLVYVGHALTRAALTPGSRLIVNMGPRTGKSLLISKWLPVWYLNLFPDRHVILGTHTDSLAKRYGRYVRDELQTNVACTTKVSDDNTAKDEWSTVSGGGMKCAGVGKAIMGYGAHLFVIDDPYPNWARAWSPTYRREVEEWFEAVVSTRLEPGASVIVLHHRMHPNDLTDYLLRGGGEWEHVSLPSLAVENDPLGRAPGEAICPERFPKHKLERMMRSTRNRAIWESMHQQNPLHVGAGAAYHQFNTANVSASVGFRFDLPLCFAVDFNRTPHMHALACQYDHAADCFTVIDELTESRTTIDLAAEMAEWFSALDWRGRRPEVQLFGDASGGTASMQSGVSEFIVIRDRFEAATGIRPRVRTPASNPRHVERVNAVNDVLRDAGGTRRLLIHIRCERLIADMMEQRTDRDGRLDKSDSVIGHAGDALGYWVHYLRPVGTPQPARPVRVDARRLFATTRGV
jgi:hypothetical protein